MTLPPPPGNSPQPPYGEGGGDPFGPPHGGSGGSYPGPPPGGPGGTYSGPPQQSGPPQHHAPSWQPPQQQQHPQGPPQPHWAAGPAGPPPKKGGDGLKWALGGVSLVAVIAITAAVSIAMTKGSGGNGTPTTSASPSASVSATAGNGGEIASANDKGPVNIITEDPTCSAFWPINNNYVGIQRKTGWVDRDTSIAATNWSPELRSQYEEVGKSMRTTADQIVPLVKATPHRVVRELFQQFIVFARAFSDAIPNYTAADNDLSGVAFAVSTTVANICSAIEKGSAEGRALSLEQPESPSTFAEVGDPANPASFMKTPDPTCGEWDRLLTQFAADPALVEWQKGDPNIPASRLPAGEQAINEAVGPVMAKLADDVERLGRSSPNPTVQDFAVLSAQYRRAFVAALPSYTPADSWLDGTAGRSTNAILRACKAAGG